MKLYAIKSRSTGDITGKLKDGEILSFPSEELAQLEINKYDLEATLKVATFREEPTEPCEFCDNPEDIILALKPKVTRGGPDPIITDIYMVEPNLCPMCGRSLT